MQIGKYIFFQSDNVRTSLIKKNVLISVFIKGGSVCVAFLLVPITIDYINPMQYGVWLTISSMIYWISVFDIGIGNGLKNEIAYSIAVNDERNLKKYVSTSYAILTLITVGIFSLFWLGTYFVDWNDLLNVKALNMDITPVVLLFIGFFCIQFVVQLIDAIISATQQVFISSLILLIGQLSGLILVYILKHFIPGSLFLLVIVIAGSSVVTLVLASIYLYSTKFKKFAPSFKSIDFSFVKRLLNVGGSFFLIQIGAMVLIYSNNFIITKVLGPESVTLYNIPFKLFSFISLLFSIIITPYWSAFTDAYAKKDMDWIKDNIRKLRLIWLGLSSLGVVILLLSDFLYKIWIQNAVTVPLSLSIMMFIYIIIYTWQTLHVYFLNGIGKIKLQLFVVIAGAVINIPLAVYLGKIFGLNGILGANILIFFVMAIIFTIQHDKIVKQTAKNLWNK